MSTNRRVLGFRDETVERPRGRIRLILGAMVVAVGMVIGVPAAAPAQPAAQGVATGKWNVTHGATFTGFTWRCAKNDLPRFKVTGATVRMWSAGGDRIKGFHFKYRLVPRGTDGQIQLSWNWSDNKKKSFKQGTRKSKRMTAGALGQSFESFADWDLEIKVKYPRSKRKAHRNKWRIAVNSPQCGVLSDPGRSITVG